MARNASTLSKKLRTRAVGGGVGDCHLNFFELVRASRYFRLEQVG
jgi:hypothetical protein